MFAITRKLLFLSVCVAVATASLQEEQTTVKLREDRATLVENHEVLVGNSERPGLNDADGTLDNQGSSSSGTEVYAEAPACTQHEGRRYDYPRDTDYVGRMEGVSGWLDCCYACYATDNCVSWMLNTDEEDCTFLRGMGYDLISDEEYSCGCIRDHAPDRQ